jgi:predicted amidohydrolase YtcJ
MTDSEAVVPGRPFRRMRVLLDESLRTSRMRRFAAEALAALATLSISAAALAQSNVDAVITQGKILTVDADFRVVEALAIDEGRIVALGTSAEIARHIGTDTEVIDVAGATVVPGLIDNHFHFTRAVQRWHLQVRLDGVDSRGEALRRLAEKAAGAPAGQWLMVQGGWSPRQFADAPGGFTLEELDRAAPANPLFVQQGYSVVYANSLALRAVGLSPDDGAERPAAGLATFQPPYGAFIQAIPRTSPEQLERNLTDFMRTLNAAGLTGVYSLGRGPEGESEMIEARARSGPLPLRLWETLTFEATDPASAAEAVALIERSEPNTFDSRFGVFGLGEHVYLPFFDLPNQRGPWPKEIVDEYVGLATAAARGGWHIHEHTMSNHSVGDLLDRFEALNESVPMDHLRWTLAHVYDITPANIERAKALGMTLAVHGVAMHGGVRMPLRGIQDSGIVFGLGTDATIVSHYQPFVTLGWVVSGLDLAGRSVLDETLTREEALIAHTRSNAYLFFQEENLGSLEVGKLADLVVLDRDYMSVPAAEIRSIRPTLTVVGGRVVYRAPNSRRY